MFLAMNTPLNTYVMLDEHLFNHFWSTFYCFASLKLHTYITKPSVIFIELIRELIITVLFIIKTQIDIALNTYSIRKITE